MLTGRNMIGMETFTTIPPKVCKTCGKTFCIANQKYVYKDRQTAHGDGV